MTVAARTVDDLIGLPWRLGARGPEEYDCLGLVIELAGLEVPVTEGLFRTIRSMREQLQRVEDGSILPGDVLYWPHAAERHVAFVESRAFLVESRESLGVHRTRLRYALEERAMPEVYRCVSP